MTQKEEQLLQKLKFVAPLEPQDFDEKFAKKHLQQKYIFGLQEQFKSLQKITDPDEQDSKTINQHKFIYKLSKERITKIFRNKSVMQQKIQNDLKRNIKVLSNQNLSIPNSIKINYKQDKKLMQKKYIDNPHLSYFNTYVPSQSERFQKQNDPLVHKNMKKLIGQGIINNYIVEDFIQQKKREIQQIENSKNVSLKKIQFQKHEKQQDKNFKILMRRVTTANTLDSNRQLNLSKMINIQDRINNFKLNNYDVKSIQLLDLPQQTNQKLLFEQEDLLKFSQSVQQIVSVKQQNIVRGISKTVQGNISKTPYEINETLQTHFQISDMLKERRKNVRYISSQDYMSTEQIVQEQDFTDNNFINKTRESLQTNNYIDTYNIIKQQCQIVQKKNNNIMLKIKRCKTQNCKKFINLFDQIQSVGDQDNNN